MRAIVCDGYDRVLSVMVQLFSAFVQCYYINSLVLVQSLFLGIFRLLSSVLTYWVLLAPPRLGLEEGGLVFFLSLCPVNLVASLIFKFAALQFSPGGYW